MKAVAPVNSKVEERESQVVAPSTSELDTIIDKIAVLESSNGLHQPTQCTNKGMINKWGYGVYGNNVMCFQNDEEAKETIKGWFKKQKDSGLEIEEMLCKYNTGRPTMDCGYLQSYKRLIN